VNAVGAYTRDTRELDSAAVQRARLYVDRRESARAEAGDFLLPLAEGAIRDSHLLGELGDLLEGRVEGRTSPEDVTLFKSLGLAVQDLAAVAALVERIEREEQGTTRAKEPPGLLRTDPPVRTPPDG
jgi:alanine dehydrogenase